MLKYRLGELESLLDANAVMKMVYQDPGRIIVGEGCFIAGFKKLLVTAIALLGLLALAGCGSSGILSDSATAKTSSATQVDSKAEHSDRYDSRKIIKRGGRENGEGKIWFGEEPEDPLEKLVYASQQFADKPLQLRTIESRQGVESDFVGKTDICDPKVVDRYSSIGLKKLEDIRNVESDDLYVCAYEYRRGTEFNATIMIGFPNFDLHRRVTRFDAQDPEKFNGGGSGVDCSTMFTTTQGDILFTGYTDNRTNGNREVFCERVKLVRQLFMNVQGGSRAEISAG